MITKKNNIDSKVILQSKNKCKKRNLYLAKLLIAIMIVIKM